MRPLRAVPPGALAGVFLLVAAPARAGAPVVAPREIEDPTGVALARFHAACGALEAGRRTEPVRIVVYGDSNLTSDRLTAALRRILQARWGDAGHGFVAFGDPWPGYRHKDVRHGAWGDLATVTHRTGWDRRLGFAGVAVDALRPGILFVGTSDEGPVGRRVRRMRVLYLARRGRGGVEVRLDGEPLGSFSTRADRTGSGEFTVEAPDGPHQLQLRPHGAARLFGAALERDGPGVVVDSIGIGAVSTRILLQYDRRLFVEQLAMRRPDLVVLTMGTNELEAGLAAERTRLLQRLREAAPDVAVLWLSPADHARRRGGSWRSEPRMERVARETREIAAATGTASWDLFAAMGGSGSMPEWARFGFAHADRIHYRQPLADRLGRALVDALDRDRARWSASVRAGYRARIASTSAPAITP